MAPVRVLCVYRVKKGKAPAFLKILRKHWPALRDLGLATGEPAQVWRCEAKRGEGTSFVEIFSWADEEASDAAHRTPEVMALWGPMDPLLAGMDLFLAEPLDLHGAAARHAAGAGRKRASGAGKGPARRLPRARSGATRSG